MVTKRLQSFRRNTSKIKNFKKAGVVDENQGFVDFLTGVLNFIEDGSLKDADISTIVVKIQKIIKMDIIWMKRLI